MQESQEERTQYMVLVTDTSYDLREVRGLRGSGAAGWRLGPWGSNARTI